MLEIKKELDLELILDKRCKTYTLNTLGNKYLAECIISKDKTKGLIEIMVKYYPRNDLVNIIVYPIINSFKIFRV